MLKGVCYCPKPQKFNADFDFGKLYCSVKMT